jgi:hypothetical protein
MTTRHLRKEPHRIPVLRWRDAYQRERPDLAGKARRNWTLADIVTRGISGHATAGNAAALLDRVR